LIKITATGGVLSVAKKELMLSSLKRNDAIVSTAKDYGLQVAAHAHW
jgi:imidazolonepropionase-like amidohydrolase